MHQRVKAVRSRHRSRENVYLRRIAFRTENHFFTPVAKEVRHQVRVIFRTLVSNQPKRCLAIKIGFDFPILLIKLAHNRTVQEFVLKVAVEINPEARRNHAPQIGIFRIEGIRELNRRSLGRMHFTRHVRPQLVTAASGIDIGCHGTAIFLLHGRQITKQEFSLVIAKLSDIPGTIKMRVNRPNFQARVIRVKIADIGGIAITKPSRVTEGSVVIQGSRPIHNLIEAVAIQVTDNDIEVALAKEPLARCFRLVEPALLQVLAVKVISHHIGRRIVTAGNNQARMNAIEISRRRQEPVAAVTVGIAPVETQRIIGAKISDIARREIVNRRYFRAIATPEHRQVFRTCNNHPRRIAVILGRIPNDLALAINGSVSGLHDNFGLAVTVVVIHLERRVVRPRADVPAEAYAPKLFTVELIGIEENRSRIGAYHLLRIVLEIVREPLHDQFIFTVAIQVADTHVVRIVTANRIYGIRHHLACRAVQLEDLVREGLAVKGNGRIENEGCGFLFAFLAIYDSRDRVLRRYFPILVQVVGPVRFPDGRNLFAVTVKVEFRIGFFRTKKAPRNEHPRFAYVCDNKATVNGLQLAGMCKGLERQREEQRRDNRKETETGMSCHNFSRLVVDYSRNIP